MAPTGKKGSALDRIIVAIAQLHSAGDEDPSKETIGLYSGVDPKNSTMRNACAAMKKQGLVVPETFQLTQKGHDHARNLDIELPKSDEEFHDQFKKKAKELGNKKSVEVYDLLRFGPPLTKPEIAKAIGVDVKKSTFRNTITPLNKLGLLEELPGKQFRLADKCFPLGRDHGKKVDPN